MKYCGLLQFLGAEEDNDTLVETPFILKNILLLLVTSSCEVIATKQECPDDKTKT